MKQNKRVFSNEFKYETVQLVLTQNYTIEAAAIAMNVGKSTLGKWIKQVKAEQKNGLQTKSAITPEQQRIRELEKRIKRIELENDILKKATALLMSDSIKNLS